VVERANEILAAGIGKSEGMADIDPIGTCVEEDWKGGKLVGLTSRANESIDCMLDRHSELVQFL
jgi:hypothetical protein